MLQTLQEKKYQVTKKIKLSRLLVQRINEIKYRQETTQNVLTVLHNTLHYSALSEIVSLVGEVVLLCKKGKLTTRIKCEKVS